MATPYSGRYSKPLGCSRHAMGGAAQDLGIEALAGETDLVTVFDDFNSVMTTTALPVAVTGDAATNAFTDSGWVLSDAGTTTTPVAGTIGMNDPAVVGDVYESSLKIFSGTADDEGGNMQLDAINADLASAANNLTALSTTRTFPHIWFPETGAGVTAADHTTWMFACRIGFKADITTTSGPDAVGDWDSKAFIGFAVAGEAAVLAPATGVISVTAAADQVLGFHMCELGEIYGVSQRVGTTAYVEGTNRVTIRGAGGINGYVANGVETAGDVKWFDLALRMDVSDWNAAENGTTTFYSRELNFGEQTGDWSQHPTVLQNQVPYHTVALVPTIELVNGPTAGCDGLIMVDWWAMGRNRVNR